METPLEKVDQVATEKLKELETVIEIAKDVAPNSSEATERDKFLSQIRSLEKRLDETVGERDKFKKERDEANDALKSMNISSTDHKSKFDEIFGGD